MGEQVTRVRLSLYCPDCMPGYHLPFLGAAAKGGLFADQGFDVEILEPPLGGGADNVERVAAGGADFCLTSVAYYLEACSRVEDLAARFIAVVGRRSPIAAIVAADSPPSSPTDLGGLRLGAQREDHLLIEYEAALVRHTAAPSVVIDMPYAEAPAALGRGEIDVVPDFADLVPRVRRRSGIDVRAIPIGVARYANGVVAGDHVPEGHVATMRAAVMAALERQQMAAGTGLDSLVARYPHVDPADALEGWTLAAGTIFGHEPAGSMDHRGWAASLAYFGAVLGLPVPEAEAVYRPI